MKSLSMFLVTVLLSYNTFAAPVLCGVEVTGEIINIRTNIDYDHLSLRQVEGYLKVDTKNIKKCSYQFGGDQGDAVVATLPNREIRAYIYPYFL